MNLYRTEGGSSASLVVTVLLNSSCLLLARYLSYLGQSKEGVRGSPNVLSGPCRPPLPPPAPEASLTLEQLTPATPTITIECKKDALSADLRR